MENLERDLVNYMILIELLYMRGNGRMIKHMVKGYGIIMK
jgi:hypothetical protein